MLSYLKLDRRLLDQPIRHSCLHSFVLIKLSSATSVAHQAAPDPAPVQPVYHSPLYLYGKTQGSPATVWQAGGSGRHWNSALLREVSSPPYPIFGSTLVRKPTTELPSGQELTPQIPKFPSPGKCNCPLESINLTPFAALSSPIEKITSSKNKNFLSLFK